jgi:superfamily II DNA or RNA helicase
MNNNLRNIIQEKACKTILIVKDLIINISIRVGKTRLALMSIEKEDKILVCYPNITVKKSWENELKLYEPLSTNITFTTFSSLKKYKNQYFDYIIIDEIQKLSINNINTLKTIKYNKRVGLSGTLSDKTLTKLKYNLNLEVGFKYSIEDAIKDNLVKDYKIIVNYCYLDNTKSIFKYKKFGKDVFGTEKEVYDFYTKTMDYFDTKYQETGETKYKFGYKKYMGLRTNLLYNSSNLLKLAQNLVYKYKDNKCLIYTLRQDIANKLSKEVYHSGNKKDHILEDFKESRTGHLSVINCVTAGVTIKNLSTVIIHSFESNTETLMQKIARSLLYQFDGDISVVNICCIKDTQSQKWLDKALESLDKNKITYLN